jgi:serine/threonine-protein kinase
MPLPADTKLGPYRLTAQIGAGGMGEVYRATDTRLDRTVAVKVLPEHLASDYQRRQRFEREARAVSSLNHPHICTLFDVGEQDGTLFLVMELIEGQTLAERLQKGRLPLDRVLDYATQMADALDKAHRRGVTHRDLKPGNIMLGKSGVKLLDFGLAKLKSDGGAVSAMSQMPTKSGGAVTGEGVILGTLQYMAPEQLEGKDADARTDIFAFGAVVYEMVTGKKAFEGTSHASLISSIMSSEPQPMAELEAMTPRSLERLIRQCLAKDPDERWQSAGDLMRELKWIADGSAEGESTTHKFTAAGLKTVAVVGTLTFVIGALLSGSAVQWLGRAPAPGDGSGAQRTEIALEPDRLAVSDFPRAWIPQLALSPDGSTLVVSVERDGKMLLKVRYLDSFEWRDLPGTEGGRHPFFSPEGEWVGFFTDQELKKVALSGGAPQPIGRVTFGLGGSWGGMDGKTIIYAERAVVMRISADGGEPSLVLQREGGDTFLAPEFLPGGQAFLVTVERTTFSRSIEHVRLDTGKRQTVVSRGAAPH